MELLQLRYFMVAAHFQNITQAAKHLHVAQPSISQAIARLEKELDVKLFDRGGKRIQLNPCGVLFLHTVESTLENLDKSLNELQLFKSTSETPLVISIWPQSALCTRILTSFSDHYPYTNLKVVPGNDLDYDLALLNLSSLQPPPSNSEVVLQEELMLAVHKNHPLAQYDSLPLESAKNENFIMLTKNSPFRQIVEAFCALANFTPKIIFESDYAETLHRMLRLGLGVSLLPEKSWGSKNSQHIKLIKITSPVCLRVVYLAWKLDRNLSSAAQLFRNFVKQYFEQECFVAAAAREKNKEVLP